jgi:aspartyl-tRNA(Asn)/glutamyl-tRNA(Gln) amidotransferase subunit C
MSEPRQRIDESQVRHIARLARIELPDEQVHRFAEQMEEILLAFNKLQELDTEGVEPMAHAVDKFNRLAEDAPHDSLGREQALANAPASRDGLFEVPKVIGDSQ